jgi:hypothetical protein
MDQRSEVSFISESILQLLALLKRRIELLKRQGITSVPGTDLVVKNTILGWIVSWSISSDSARLAEANSETPLKALHCSFKTQLLTTLEKFWTVEKISSPWNKFTVEEMSAE